MGNAAITPTSLEQIRKIAQETKTLADEIRSENEEQMFRTEKEAELYARNKVVKDNIIVRILLGWRWGNS